VRGSRVWAGLLGIEHASVERLEYDEDEQLLVAHVPTVAVPPESLWTVRESLPGL
jgi:hypothetical protein